jgi:hypothetical protein
MKKANFGCTLFICTYCSVLSNLSGANKAYTAGAAKSGELLCVDYSQSILFHTFLSIFPTTSFFIANNNYYKFSTLGITSSTIILPLPGLNPTQDCFRVWLRIPRDNLIQMSLKGVQTGYSTIRSCHSLKNMAWYK